MTAGVLRGEKGRFQLFGDSMNTASRIESTGQRNKVHISQETAVHLKAAGKEAWLCARKDKVFAKGKGQLQTYWLQITDESDVDTGSMALSTDSAKSDLLYKKSLKQQLKSLHAGDEEGQLALTHGAVKLSDKAERLVKWNVDIMLKILRQVEARRASTPGFKRTNRNGTLAQSQGEGGTLGTAIIDEVKDVLSLPQFNANVFQKHVEPTSIEISSKVAEQLTDYVTNVAAMYR